MGKLLAFGGGLCTSFGILCCFTGLLPVLLTSLGASGLMATLYRDSVLLPFAALSLVVMGVGVFMMRRTRADQRH